MENIRLHIVAVLLLASTSCSDRQLSHTKIYGGIETKYWKNVAAIISEGEIICTATAITDRLLVTAAHCLVDRSNITIVLGDSIQSNHTYEVERYGVSPKYKSSKTEWNDVGYIVTAQTMELSQSDIPVISSQKNDRYFFESNQLFTIVGFGQTESGDIGQKREAKVKLTKVESNEIELGGDGIDSCLGDSGGPAFFITDDVTTFLVAVVSRGKKCGKGGRYGRVSQHACWIQDSSGITIPELNCDS